MHSAGQKKDKQVPVMLLNTHNKSTTLFAGTNIATATSIPVVAAMTSKNEKDRKSPQEIIQQIDLSNTTLNQEQKQQLVKLLHEKVGAFAQHDDDVGYMKDFQMSIEMEDNHPVKQRPYRAEFRLKPVIEEETKKMLEMKIIEPCNSPWASPIILVPKKDGSWRYAVDFRVVNGKIRKDSYPLPIISEVLENFVNARWFSVVDMAKGFWSIPIKEENRDVTAFTTGNGLYRFTRCPFGLSNSPACWQRAMDVMLSGLQPQTVQCYVDDLIITGTTFNEHLANIGKVLDRVIAYNLRLKPSKCKFCCKSVTYLGHEIGTDGIKPGKAHVKTILNFPTPTSAAELQRWLGLSGYYRRLVPGYAALAQPLYELTKKDTIFKWTEAAETCFQKMKKLLTSEPVVAFPDLNKQFIIESDASGLAVGAVLEQFDDHGNIRPVAYFSRALTKAEKNYTVTEKEALVIVEAFKKFRQYVWGQTEVKVITDHEALIYWTKNRPATGRLSR